MTDARPNDRGRGRRRPQRPRRAAPALAGLLLAAALAAVLALPRPALADGHGRIAGELPRSGVGAVSWSGGSVLAVPAAVSAGGGCALRSVSANGPDTLVRYAFGGGAAANRAFLDAYPDGALPAGTLLLLACSDTAPGPDPETEPGLFAKAFVRQAIDRYAAEGRDAALAYYNSPASVRGEWYVFIADADGTIAAHGARPGNVGLNLRDDDDFGPDIDGFRYGPAIAAAGEEGRWVSYVYLNPADDDNLWRKHSWVVRYDGLVFGAGWYQRAAEPPAPAPDRATEPGLFTKAFVQQALDRYRAGGRDAAIAYYSSSESVDGPWYVFVIDAADGAVLAHPLANRVGNNLLTDADYGTDVRGYRFGPDLVGASEDGEWVSYHRLHPETGREQPKHSWVVRHDDLVFGSGWYERPQAAAAPAPDRATEPGLFTKAFVQQALDRYRAEGRDAAIAHHNTPGSVDGEWYVFVIDAAEGTIVSHPTVPGNVGQSVLGPIGTDVAGNRYGPAILAADEAGRWVSYVYLNPADDNNQWYKHSWVVRRGGLIFGAGWYQRKY